MFAWEFLSALLQAMVQYAIRRGYHYNGGDIDRYDDGILSLYFRMGPHPEYQVIVKVYIGGPWTKPTAFVTCNKDARLGEFKKVLEKSRCVVHVERY